MSSSSMSPSWIAGGSSRLRMEHFNLWPSTSVTASGGSAAATWAAYSSALATLTLNQLNEVKYPHHRGPSPLTPTTPTYAPDSPSSIIGHADIQPDSPHSVDYHPDSFTDYPADPADYCLTTSLNPRKHKRSQSGAAVAYPASKKKKSFTIDSILGLDCEQQQQQPQMFNKPVTQGKHFSLETISNEIFLNFLKIINRNICGMS